MLAKLTQHPRPLKFTAIFCFPIHQIPTNVIAHQDGTYVILLFLTALTRPEINLSEPYLNVSDDSQVGFC